MWANALGRLAAGQAVDATFIGDLAAAYDGAVAGTDNLQGKRGSLFGQMAFNPRSIPQVLRRAPLPATALV